MSDKLKLSFAGQYAPNVENTGYWKSPMFPGGENPATVITNELSTLTIIGGVVSASDPGWTFGPHGQTLGDAPGERNANPGPVFCRGAHGD